MTPFSVASSKKNSHFSRTFSINQNLEKKTFTIRKLLNNTDLSFTFFMFFETLISEYFSDYENDCWWKKLRKIKSLILIQVKTKV